MKKLFLHITFAGTLAAFASCSRDPARLQVLTDKLAELEERSDALRREVMAQRRAVESVSSEREHLMMERAKTGQDIQKLLASLNSAEADFATYKKDYRRAIQERAKGIELGELNIEGMEVLQKVVVSSATDTELTVVHTNGMAKVPLAKAPARIQDLFGFDPSVRNSSEVDGKAQLDQAILMGKKTVQINKERLAKIARDSQLKFPSAAPAAPSDAGPPWKKSSTFEGSFYAPLKGKSQGSSKPKTTSNMGKPL